MKETPMLYSRPMVQATIARRKTKTRRVIKPQPPEQFLNHGNAIAFVTDKTLNHTVHCPYGKPGDLIWVKESFYAYGHWTTITDNTGKRKSIFQDLTRDNFYLHQYAAEWQPKKVAKKGELGWHKRSSLFMPKRIARIWLKINDVNVQRIQDITPMDSEAEGIKMLSGGTFWWQNYLNEGLPGFKSAVQSFKSLWQSINGKDSWNENPWVWVIEFKLLSTTGKPKETA